MNYSFTSDLKDGYLHVRVRGDNTTSVIRRYMKDVFQASIAEGCSTVLIEEMLEGPRLSIGDIFAIVSEQTAAARGALRLVAYVDLNSPSPTNMKFAETVAVNRGVTVCAFVKVADAEKWLLKKLDLRSRNPKPGGS